MPRINIVGIGPGNDVTITKEAEITIRKSLCLMGDKRVLAPFAGLGKPVIDSSSAEDIMNHVKDYSDKEEVAILVSGDVGFYSLAKTLLEKLPKEDVRLICGISSLQYFCAKLQTGWEDVVSVSLHGRSADILAKVVRNRKVFVLADGVNTPAEICRSLYQSGLEELEVSVGEKLSYPEERIITAPVKELIEISFASLSVIMIVNPYPLTREVITHGLPDDWFIRSDVPMTKQEIRAVSLSKLELKAGDTAYDIGAGTGSVAVEMALQLEESFVYALEKDPEALQLIDQNKKKFGVSNLVIVAAAAPDQLEWLPKPDKVFIGGTGGQLSSILDKVYDKNPLVRVVINAITLETLGETITYYKQKPEIEVEVVHMTVSKARKSGEYHLLTGQNPIYVITAQKRSSSNL